MNDIEKEISTLENKLMQADIKTDPAFFQEYVAEDAILTGQEGNLFTKTDLLKAHTPAGESKFSRFDVSDMKIKDLETSAVVTCRIDLVGKGFDMGLRFTRIWHKKNGKWQIVAGQITTVAK